MAAKKRYEFNAETLAYELHKVPFMKRLSKGMIMFLLSLLAAGCWYFLYIKVFKLETPRTVQLRQTTAKLRSKLEVLDRRMDANRHILQELQMRDNNVYRPIFGMDEIPAEERNEGYTLALAAVGRLMAGAQPLGRMTNSVARIYAFRARPDGVA